MFRFFNGSTATNVAASNSSFLSNWASLPFNVAGMFSSTTTKYVPAGTLAIVPVATSNAFKFRYSSPFLKMLPSNLSPADVRLKPSPPIVSFILAMSAFCSAVYLQRIRAVPASSTLTTLFVWANANAFATVTPFRYKIPFPSFLNSTFAAVVPPTAAKIELYSVPTSALPAFDASVVKFPLRSKVRYLPVVLFCKV